jgi:GNAT superfamily N-acetyltransferase
MPTTNDYEVSTDRRRLDTALIHRFLSSTYWARDIPPKIVERSIKNSLCFGVYAQGRQVGFARVITDYATFGYVADVFVLPEYRRRGLAKMLMRAILDHPELRGLRRLLLATRDAHKLYAPFGFKPLANPEHFMTVHRPEIYTRGA